MRTIRLAIAAGEETQGKQSPWRQRPCTDPTKEETGPHGSFLLLRWLSGWVTCRKSEPYFSAFTKFDFIVFILIEFISNVYLPL